MSANDIHRIAAITKVIARKKVFKAVETPSSVLYPFRFCVGDKFYLFDNRIVCEKHCECETRNDNSDDAQHNPNSDKSNISPTKNGLETYESEGTTQKSANTSDIERVS